MGLSAEKEIKWTLYGVSRLKGARGFYAGYLAYRKLNVYIGRDGAKMDVRNLPDA